MASSKNNTFKVKLKPPKKRRKSDLVVMWYSLLDAVAQILTTINFLLLQLLEKARLMIWHDEIHDIRQFLKNYLPTVPDDFSNSWRDGKLLCILLNKLQTGCIPNAETLDRNYALSNMYHAFDILERKFGISPTASVEQLVVCVEGSDLKLLDILFQLKKETEKREIVSTIQVEDVESDYEKQISFSDSKNCVCRGTGLMVAFVGRPANFVIFISMMTDISLVIEIKGPDETVCRERITKRSPKKKMSTSLLEQSKPPFFRSNSFSEKHNYQTEINKANDCEKSLIPLEYDISLDKISVTYTPLVEGEHIISILWYGQHVSDSPYIVKVETKIGVKKAIYSEKQFIPSFQIQDNSDGNANKERKNGTVTILKPVNKIERIGKVIKRRVLRHIVKIKDKDIIVDSNDIEHLAAALLKMDYEIQTDPSKSRRNSWGFDGDAERKISAIRQFFIPLHDLDMQNMKLYGRSRSLTINSNARMSLKRCNSLEDEDFIKQTTLETVSEDATNGFTQRICENMDKNEEEFAYINEDFQILEHIPDGNQVGILEENTEKVCSTYSSLSSIAQENKLQSLLSTKEECNDNDLNARILEELPQTNLTSSSEMSVKSAVQNEIQFNSEVFENTKNELNLSENSIIESCNAFEKINISVMPQNDLNSSNEFCKGKAVENKLPYKPDIYDDIEKEIRLNTKTFNDCHNNDLISSDALKNLDKCGASFSEIKSQERHDSKATFQFLSPNVDEVNNSIMPTPILSKYSFLSKKNPQNRLGDRRCCKSCRKLEALNRKLYAHNKKLNMYSKTKSSCQNYTQNSVISMSKNIEMNINHAVETKSNVRNTKPNELEFDNSAFCESPEKNSFKYPSPLFENRITSPQYPLPSRIIEKNESNHIISKRFQLSSKTETFTNSLTNSDQNDLYNNSTLRLNYDFANNLTLSELDFDNPNMKFDDITGTECQTKEHNLISLEQYNFNQFNPSVEKNKGSLIKNKIKKLEKAVMRDSRKVNSKYSSHSNISSDMVNVKGKLTFWENLSRKDIDVNKIETDDSLSEDNQFQNELLTSNPKDLEHDDMAIEKLYEPGDDAFNRPRDDVSNNESNSHSQCIDSKRMERPYVQKKCYPRLKRSFSEAMLLDPAVRDSLYFAQNPLNILKKQNHMSSTENMSSSGDYLESSIDDGLYSSDPFVSTEDEYIDDEIPGNPLLNHWGDLNPMKNLKAASVSKYKEYCQFIDTEVLKNQFQSVDICPSECKVFGISTYYGYVAVKNRFQVLTKGAGNGNLSASVQGFGKHDVSFVNVKYKHRDIYEVTYQVLRPGLYLISVRWMEKPIVGSPFICKVTF